MAEGRVALQGEDHTSRGDVMRRLREAERDRNAMKNSHRLEAASIHRGGIRIADQGSIRSTNFDGDPADVTGDPGENGWVLGPAGLVVNDGVFRGEVRSANFEEGVSGFQLLPTGDAEFNTLTLRDQLISPDALRQMFRRASGSASNFFPGTGGTTANANVAVPDWATAAEVDVWAAATLTNTTGADESIILDLTIDGDHEISHRVTVPAGGDGHVTAFTFAQLFETFGTLGDPIACSATVRTASNTWGQTATNLVQIHAVADLFD